jgi:hypothetical protein
MKGRVRNGPVFKPFGAGNEVGDSRRSDMKLPEGIKPFWRLFIIRPDITFFGRLLEHIFLILKKGGRRTRVKTCFYLYFIYRTERRYENGSQETQFNGSGGHFSL